MGDDYGYSQSRNKSKDKRKKRKAFPYKHGGKFRAQEINSQSVK